MAFAYGLIGQDERHDLNEIRDIRNDAAHMLKHEHFSFAEPALQKRISGMKAAKFSVVTLLSPKQVQEVVSGKADPKAFKYYLIMVVFGLIRKLALKVSHTSRKNLSDLSHERGAA